MRSLRSSLLLLLMAAGCYHAPDRITTPSQGAAGGGGAAAADDSAGDSSSDGSAAPTSVTVTVEGGECPKNMDYILEEPGDTDSGLIPTGGGVDVTAKGLPATFCLSEDTNECSTNKINLTAGMKTITIGDDCHSLSAE